MTPNLRFNLDIEPITFIWSGKRYNFSGQYQLLPDNEVKHLHKRVMCVARDRRPRGAKIPFEGIVVGCAKYHDEYIYLVQDDSGEIERVRKPEVIG